MSAYETSVTIPSFAGLNQSGDGYNQSMRYAREMENVNVEGGSFKPMREGLRIEQVLEKPIGTLAYLYRRYTGGDTLLVAIADGCVYTKTLDGTDEWVQRYPAESEESDITVDDSAESEESDITVDDSAEGEESDITDDDCDWVTYEVTQDGQTSPTDILLFTNATDGMFCLYGDDLHVEAVETPYNFGVIARYNERIWGAGITDMPDSLVYSAPYDPFDWEARTEIPEDGAGEIMLPSWDGDSFQALRQYGNSLLAFKRNAVWRVYGTNPGEFSISQQYGGGTIEENTVAVSNEHVYMLGGKGLLRYDGSGAYPFLQDAVKDLMHDHVNQQYIHLATAGMRNGTYCLAMPINNSTFCNAILEYNTHESALALRTGVSVDAFLQIDERLFYTSATEPGRVIELRDDVGQPLNCVWKSGFQDLGVKNSIKSAFWLYMLVDVEAPVEFYIGIRTEKKLKQKVITAKPGKPVRTLLNNTGRFFSLEIRSYSAVPFDISGGIQIMLELDPD